jgi:hypothetical protein
MLLLPPLLVALRALASLGALGGPAAAVALPSWGPVALAATLLFAAVAYRRCGVSALYALAYPAGAAVLLTIVVQALARGRRVDWKGREYVT